MSRLRRTRHDGPLRVNMLPTFANNWLSPRLIEYPFARRGFSLEISTSQEQANLAASVADAGIWYGDGQWDGLQADLLFQATIDLYARPGFASGSRHQRLQRVASANFFCFAALPDLATLAEHFTGRTVPTGHVDPRGFGRPDDASSRRRGGGVDCGVRIGRERGPMRAPDFGVRPSGARRSGFLARLSTRAVRRSAARQLAYLAAGAMPRKTHDTTSPAANGINTHPLDGRKAGPSAPTAAHSPYKRTK